MLSVSGLHAQCKILILILIACSLPPVLITCDYVVPVSNFMSAAAAAAAYTVSCYMCN